MILFRTWTTITINWGIWLFSFAVRCNEHDKINCCVTAHKSNAHRQSGPSICLRMLNCDGIASNCISVAERELPEVNLQVINSQSIDTFTQCFHFWCKLISGLRRYRAANHTHCVRLFSTGNGKQHRELRQTNEWCWSKKVGLSDNRALKSAWPTSEIASEPLSRNHARNYLNRCFSIRH